MSVSSTTGLETTMTTKTIDLLVLLRGESRQPYPPLNDLLRARPYLHPTWPIERILHMGDLHAEVVEDFIAGQQYDAALREHTMASVIATEIIPLHKEYSYIQSDGNFLYKTFQELEKRVMAQREKIEEIKVFIREDNERYGVKATEGERPADQESVELSSIAGSGEPTSKHNEPDLLVPEVEPIAYSPYKTRRGKFFRRGYQGVGRRPPQVSIEQTLEQDYDLPECTNALSLEEKQLLAYGSREGSWGLFRCENPNCWETKDKFRSNSFSDLARHYRDAHQSEMKLESFRCDYEFCSRVADSFTRKDAYRDHLREYHQEDITKRHKNSKTEQEWLSQRVISLKWWRCARCLIRVRLDVNGWSCPECKQSCEAERVAIRRAMNRFLATSYGEHQDTPRPRQVMLNWVGDEHRYKNLSPSTRITVPRVNSQGAALKSLTLPNMPPDIKAQIAKEPPTSSIKPVETSDCVTAQVPGLVVECGSEPSIDHQFCHIEYSNLAAVPFISFKQLGRGSLGIVDAVRHNGDETGVLFARKVIGLPNMARKRLLPIIQQEVAVQKELNHQHIVKVMCTYETTSVPRQFGILLFPVGDEDLNHYLERVGENEFPEQDVGHLQKWQYCLASAVAYIHSQKIRHKDIKPSNAICKGDEIFLTDFGSAHQFSAGLTSSTEGYAAGVTRMYSAPEVIEEERRGRPADIYSLGCVFAEMTTVIHGRRVEDFHEFRSEPDPDDPNRMTLCYYATVHKVFDWFKTGCDSVSLQLITSMLIEEQRLRPTAEEVVEMLDGPSRYSDCSCRLLSSAWADLGSNYLVEAGNNAEIDADIRASNSHNDFVSKTDVKETVNEDDRLFE